jgi:hypothetical protein
MMAGLVGRTAQEPMASILCAQERAYTRLQADREECNFFVLAAGEYYSGLCARKSRIRTLIRDVLDMVSGLFRSWPKPDLSISF